MGEEVEAKAEVIVMNEYSAHADYEDVARFLHCQDKEQIQEIFLVHGEEESMKNLKKDLEELGYRNIRIPDFRMSYELPSRKSHHSIKNS